MNILIIGSGGREHAFAWKIKQSPRLEKLFVAPGNAGTSQIAKNIDIAVDDFEKIKHFVLNENIDMVIVGPEDPLVKGISDFFINESEICHIPVIGPMKEAAKLEGSKVFAKNFMERHHIPTSRYRTFDAQSLKEADDFLSRMSAPYVLKVDGLAAGKGVLIVEDLNNAKKELRQILLKNKFGEAGNQVVIEEFLSGIEFSCFVITDGKNYKTLPIAKDYKRIGENDTGLNTGGMGAISSPLFSNPLFLDKVENRIIKPTISGLRKESMPYKGIIFIGLMKVGEDPYVIEYNVRMGDPEAQAVLPRIQSDIIDVFEALSNQTLDKIHLKIDERSTATIVAVSGGYPENYTKGKVIKGLNNIDSLLFYAGTTLKENGVVTDGGRVLSVTDFGENHNDALRKVLKSISKIHFDGMYYRRDIGFDL